MFVHLSLQITQFFNAARKGTIITLAQLSLRNGQDKPEVWVTLRGIVYDVSGSHLWRNSKQYEHWAGQDLTDELKYAPHKEKVFEKFKVMRKLNLEVGV